MTNHIGDMSLRFVIGEAFDTRLPLIRIEALVNNECQESLACMLGPPETDCPPYKCGALYGDDIIGVRDFLNRLIYSKKQVSNAESPTS